jgi:hypothetical protein
MQIRHVIYLLSLSRLQENLTLLQNTVGIKICLTALLSIYNFINSERIANISFGSFRFYTEIP